MSTYAIRLVGNSWYISHDRTAIASTDNLNDEKNPVALYRSLDAANTALLVLAASWPNWIGKIEIRRVRKIRRQVIERVSEDSGELRKYEKDHYVSH